MDTIDTKGSLVIKPKTYRCKKGHVFAEPGFSFSVFHISLDSGILCPYCFCDFLKEQFGGGIEIPSDS